MKCPQCNSEMALIDFCEDIRIYRCPECLYDCTINDSDVE